MSDLVPEGSTVATGPLAKAAYAIGSIGLLSATAADSLAVAGRHTGLPLIGSIELVQAAVILLASAGIVIATVVGGHASVHIVTERVSKPTAARMARAADVVSALVFILLAVGSALILLDLWTGHERSELLHIPLRWLRLIWIVATLVAALQFLRNARKRAA
jgi:TRAP-type C4-dicarboxylate transport system permease small subunit